MQLSIVIPAYNEAVNLEAFVTRFIESAPEALAPILREVIVVENGSKDGTLDACRRLQQRFPQLVEVRTLGRGSYGEAIKTGMLQSQGTHVSILECDFLDWRFVAASIEAIRNGGAQFVVGSKRHRKSVDRRPIKRRMLTFLYNLVFLRILMGYRGTDTHGLKTIETRVAKRLCEIAMTTDEIFQTEIVLLAWRLGVAIEEVPVQILEMRNPTVSVRRRLPKVINTVDALKQSLARFPKDSAQLEEQRRLLPQESE